MAGAPNGNDDAAGAATAPGVASAVSERDGVEALLAPLAGATLPALAGARVVTEPAGAAIVAGACASTRPTASGAAPSQ